MPNAARIIELYRRFPLTTATALVVSEGVRAVMNPAARTVYGQTGEDRIIEALIDISKPDFYVDVGCNDPFQKSNTLNLYTRGWRGLVIDGNPELIKRFRRYRPNDIAVCAVVSDQSCEMEFSVAAAHEMSTVSQQFKQDFLKAGDIVSSRKVNSVRLNDIMVQQNVPSRFGVLSVDCEGHDYEVIMSFDLDQFRPSLIVVEIHNLQLDKCTEHPLVCYLTQNNYQMAAYAVMNGYFIDRS
jgi:FkbM family methyltransferase